MRVNHVGHLVNNLDKAVDHYRALGFKVFWPEYEDDFLDQRVVFMRSEDGAYDVELICPRSEDATSAPLLKKRGVGLYHICLTTDSFDRSYEELRRRRFVPTAPPTTAKTGPLSGRRLAFLMNPTFGLIELIEESEE